MSRVDVRECVADVVLAFDTGAHLTEVLMGKSSKKRWKKEKDVETAVEQKLLHNALVESAAQCRRWSWERRQQFGDAFDTGDALAKAQLRDVFACLQTEVIQVVQDVTARRYGAPTLLKAHETTITSRQNALRAIDELCRRIVDGTTQNRGHHDTALADYVQTLSRSSTISSHLSTSDAATDIQYSGFYRSLPLISPQGLYAELGQSINLTRQDSFHDTPAVNILHRQPTLQPGIYASNHERLDPVAELPDDEDIFSPYDSLRSVSISGGASSDGTASFDTASSWSQTYSPPVQTYKISSSESRALDAPEVVSF